MSCSLLDATQQISFQKGSLAHRIYDAERVTEKFNCQYSLNEGFRTQLEKSGLKCSGTNDDGDVRVIELPSHNFFLATLFQPQLSSSRQAVHPIIAAFMQAANDQASSS